MVEATRTRRPKKSSPKRTSAARHTQAPAERSARLGSFYSAGPVVASPANLQAKLAVGAVNDVYEQEADAVAAQAVAGGSAPPVSQLPPDGPGATQRQPLEEAAEDSVQSLAVQRQETAAPADEEEPVQTMAVQRQPDEAEEDAPVQALNAQRQPLAAEAEADDAVQTLAVQRQVEEAGEEAIQEGSVQRQAEASTEEEPAQPLLAQRQAEEPDEERDQAPSVQRQAGESSEEAADEPVQMLAVQRQTEAGGEAPEEATQPLPVQRQSVEKEEAPVQTLSLQRLPETDEEGDAVQRAGKQPSPVSPVAEAVIRNPGAGRPILPGVRRRIEPYVGADLSGVRVHTGAQANRAANMLQARAFAHRNHVFLNSSESSGDVRLMAHEATHVVQQGAAPRQGQMGLSATAAGVQRLPDFIAEELNDYARYIPGYTLFTVIIGFNPLTGDAVERNAVNLLQGLMGLTPFGTFIFDTLQRYGIIQDAFDWVETQMGHLNLSLARIEETLEAAWDDVRIIEGFDYNLAVLRRHFGRLYDDVVAFVTSLIDHIIQLIKDAVVGVVDDLLAENQVWALIKKILRYDPLKDEAVEATTVEILEDFLRLIGKEQELEQMRERGTLQDTAAWLDTQLAIFFSLLLELRGLFTVAWEAIQPENLPNLPDNLANLASQAVGLLQRVWDFATTVAAKVLELIKNALLGWLRSFANDIPGYPLLTVILGRDVFTQEAVPRTATNLIRGFMSLVPGGEQQFQQMQETGVIPAAAQRIEGAMSELGISWQMVQDLFLGIWTGLTIEDLIDPIGAFQRILEQFGEPISRLFAFVRVVIREMLMLVLQMMNFPIDLIGSIISNAMQAFEDIKNDPVGFLMNMLRAVKQGFTSFFDNILTHLIGGLADWLFRGLRDAGIEPPADLSLQSVLDFVLQVLGIRMERIWEKLAERIGQENVDRIRGAIDRLTGIWNFVRDVQERGVAAIWEHIESQISGLWDMVLEKAQEWIMARVINRAIQWLLSLLDPTGIMPVINSFIAFFNAVQSAIEYLRDILAIINDYVSTLASVARGAIEPGAQKLEQGLANAIPIAIGFLANQFGLGNIGEKIQEIVGGIRELVERALDWLLDRAVSMGQSVLRMLGFGGEGEEAPASEPEGTIVVDVTMEGMSHDLIVQPGSDAEIEMSSPNRGKLSDKIRATTRDLQRQDPKPEAQINDLRDLEVKVQSLERRVRRSRDTDIDSSQFPIPDQLAELSQSLRNYSQKYGVNDIDVLGQDNLRAHPAYQWIQQRGLEGDFAARIVNHIDTFSVELITAIFDQIVRFAGNPAFEEKVNRAITTNRWWSDNDSFFFEIVGLRSIADVQQLDVGVGGSNIDVLTGSGILIDHKIEVVADYNVYGVPELGARMQRQIADMQAAVGTTIFGITVQNFEIQYARPLSDEARQAISIAGLDAHFRQSAEGGLF